MERTNLSVSHTEVERSIRDHTSHSLRRNQGDGNRPNYLLRSLPVGLVARTLHSSLRKRVSNTENTYGTKGGGVT